jgi:hypothetical protein
MKSDLTRANLQLLLLEPVEIGKIRDLKRL